MMKKKTLTKVEIDLIRLMSGSVISTSPDTETNEGPGDGEAAGVRQQTDFFGNTVLVPMDDDWE